MIDFLPGEINYRLIYNDICDDLSEPRLDSEHYDVVGEIHEKGTQEDHENTVLRPSNVILIEEFEFQMLSTCSHKATRCILDKILANKERGSIMTPGPSGVFDHLFSS